MVVTTFANGAGTDPEIFHRGWLHVLYYTELWGVAGKH